MRLLVCLLAAVALFSYTGPAIAAGGAGAGFWAGFVDGFLCLSKLVLGAFFDFDLVSASLRGGSYGFGYYLGVLSFAAGAGAAGYSGSAHDAQVESV